MFTYEALMKNYLAHEVRVRSAIQKKGQNIAVNTLGCNEESSAIAL